jgi:hypothetical protein
VVSTRVGFSGDFVSFYNMLMRCVLELTAFSLVNPQIYVKDYLNTSFVEEHTFPHTADT